MSSLCWNIIRDEKEFRSLARDWNRLAAETDAKSVFLRHEWADAAWQWLRTDECELRVVCVEKNGHVEGILPLIIRRIAISLVNVRQLECLAVPDTQEFSLLACSTNVDEVADCIFAALASDEIAWDVMKLEKLPEDLATTNAIAHAATRHGFFSRILNQHENPGIRLDDTWEEYYGRRSRRLKKGNNLVRNKLQRDGKVVEVKCIEDIDPGPELDELISTLARLSARSWKADTGLTLENPGPAAFLTRLGQSAAECSWLLTWLLTINGEPVAMELQLKFEGVVSGLRADYDERVAEYSPGTLLNWRIIEKLFDSDASYYSLGPGSNSYKARWTETGKKLCDIMVYGASPFGRVAGVVETKLKPIVKKLMQRQS